MKSAMRIIIISLYIMILFGCSMNKNVESKYFQGDYADAYVNVNAEASLKREENEYEVHVNIENRSDHDVQLVYECGELIRYEGRPEQIECTNIYSEGLESEKVKELTSLIPAERLTISNDMILIKIIYELGVGEDRTVVGIPLNIDKNTK
ncbi:hypothetical protein [Pontibacillus marinus]|uniref:DUF4352 domain-containing protein n=2 Tax=Pontibacillus TaxID=289201 RepID=A0A0A5G6J1_9BACI|nr:hypothetical protein [Pontibacillus marinus]KGX87654.1 hypothetical protein N783_09560 [Pontibacillus marinus BH030004 = DSM 16465]